MAPILPDDILHLICEELAAQEQFDTLFNCACTNRSLAIPALTNLYKSHHRAPVRDAGGDETVSMATKQLMVQRWSILWRSIVASAFETTLFPYCRYIRALDLRDLGYLLEDEHFRGKITKHFFSAPLAKFQIMHPGPLRRSGRGFARLDFTSITDAIGEVVTQHTPMLEQISGPLLSHALVRWAPRLPRLQALELWDGSPLEDQLVHASIYQHCPHFNSLSIFTWAAEERDHKFSEFIGTVRPQSLKNIETIRDIGASAETFLALNAHSKSLKDLKLCVSNDSLPHLSLLKGCTALEALKIEDTHGSMDLEKTQNDVFLEVIDWLLKCEDLRRLSFTKLLSAAPIVTPLLLQDRIKLRELEIDSYVPKDCAVFHQALVNQRDSLRFLSLQSGETEGMFRDDVDILVDSLKQLTELRVLKLILIQEFLHDAHLISIIENLEQLEDLYITGLELTNEILECVGKLKNLRSVTFAGISKFTMDGMLRFISNLGTGNQGIRINIDMADPDTLLADEEVNLVRENLLQKAGGTLDYTPLRDPNVSEFDTDSD